MSHQEPVAQTTTKQPSSLSLSREVRLATNGSSRVVVHGADFGPAGAANPIGATYSNAALLLLSGSGSGAGLAAGPFTVRCNARWCSVLWF